ncbi:LysR family transcriptional regulator [Parasphingopyxis algicola]|uniref:LysR family transcriptional regulator n=1 Tax=Parasphingopyxis algicola TaxID=2026624 RepID=UPI0015A4B260|nr:LysR family transcriptional regulator [Parasphingopyxis algicola]QLC26409.1 LysR family transcriptional regulator [Parasphingopyxis algicola]
MRDIRLFVAAYEERSFTAAAQRENATQSGVSQHIRKLEDRHGVKLFRRETGRVIPTLAAKVFYEHCVELLRIRASAENDLQRFEGGPVGEIVVGVMPTISSHVLAPALMRFTEEYPNVEVQAVEGYSHALTEAVLAGEIDFAVVPKQTHEPGVAMQHFLTTPEILVSGTRSGHEPMETLRLGSLPPPRLVLPGRKNCRHDSILGFLAANRIKVERTIELDSMMGTLDYIASSDWVAILPALIMAGPAYSDLLAANPFAEPSLSLDLATVSLVRAPLSIAAAAFHDVLRSEAQAADARWHEAVQQAVRP